MTEGRLFGRPIPVPELRQPTLVPLPGGQLFVSYWEDWCWELTLELDVPNAFDAEDGVVRVVAEAASLQAALDIIAAKLTKIRDWANNITKETSMSDLHLYKGPGVWCGAEDTALANTRDPSHATCAKCFEQWRAEPHAKNLIACARAAYEMRRSIATVAEPEASSIPWEDLADIRAAVVEAAQVIAGENKPTSQAVRGAIRICAASLGMTVTYPAVGNEPERVVDWSKPFEPPPAPAPTLRAAAYEQIARCAVAVHMAEQECAAGDKVVGEGTPAAKVAELRALLRLTIDDGAKLFPGGLAELVEAGQ